MSDWRKLIIACGWNNPDACSLTEQRLAELCAKRIAELREANRWIPISERLPEDNVSVLVEGGIAYRNYGQWITLMGSDAYRPIRWEVNHWMPLPPPPQEAGE